MANPFGWTLLPMCLVWVRTKNILVAGPERTETCKIGRLERNRTFDPANLPNPWRDQLAFAGSNSLPPVDGDR